MRSVSETYHWKHRDTGPKGLPIGRLLFSGADYDGKHWAGFHHPRIS